MSYKVWIGNIAVECDTVAAAIELAKGAEGIGAVPTKRPPGAKVVELPGGGSRWTEKRVTEFFRLIEGSQKKLIDTLLANNEGRTDDQLRRLLSLESGLALGGVVSGATKNARKVGADPKDLFIKKRVLIDGKKQKEYFLTEAFKTAALQVQR
jgi:enolase